ncbi:MAG: hypothetical protein JST75_04040 [Bacteroidetes bacterium]|nr:hypothetical protein [Bacteroidota bacterium]
MHYLLLISSFFLVNQNPDPTKWEFFSKKINNNTYDIHLRAKIAKGWHVYSLFNDGGPGPASVHYEKNKILKSVGDVKEIGKVQRRYEKLFDAHVREVSSTIDFVQIMQRKDTSTKTPTTVTGFVKYITCNGTLCLPPKELPFSVDVR